MRLPRTIAGTLLVSCGSLVLPAELRPAWPHPATWAQYALAVPLLAAGVAVLLHRERPRQVVFVVEPGQVPVLAARLGVVPLDDLGAPPARPRSDPRGPASAAPAPPAPAPPVPAPSPARPARPVPAPPPGRPGRPTPAPPPHRPVPVGAVTADPTGAGRCPADRDGGETRRGPRPKVVRRDSILR
jgi:hypothetical protein